MKTSWRKVLGPSLLYAGTAIDVSHLRQSTRADAECWIRLNLGCFRNTFFFEMAPRYAARTGASLLHGYEALGSGPFIYY